MTLRANTSPRFHPLAISDLRRETPDSVSLAFAVPPELEAVYAFAPGQYLTLRATIEGHDIRRSYSICSGDTDGELRVAIKQVEGGAFSTFANRELATGDRIEVMTPMGRFGQAATQASGQHHVGFASGSGITPILSIIRSVLAHDADSRFTLFYGNRNSGSVMFKDALEDLKDMHLGRLSIHHVLSREAQDIALLNGRLDGPRMAQLLRTLGHASGIDHAFLCGPAGMTDAGREALMAFGVDPARIHVELFTPSEPIGAIRAKAATVARDDAAHVPLSLTLDGAVHQLAMAPGETVLETAERAGLDIPYSCRGGMCCTCRAQVTAGASQMEQNFSLEPWEVEAGFVLTCQCRPTGDVLAVDFDAM